MEDLRKQWEDQHIKIIESAKGIEPAAGDICAHAVLYDDKIIEVTNIAGNPISLEVTDEATFKQLVAKMETGDPYMRDLYDKIKDYDFATTEDLMRKHEELRKVEYLSGNVIVICYLTFGKGWTLDVINAYINGVQNQLNKTQPKAHCSVLMNVDGTLEPSTLDCRVECINPTTISIDKYKEVEDTIHATEKLMREYMASMTPKSNAN